MHTNLKAPADPAERLEAAWAAKAILRYTGMAQPQEAPEAILVAGPPGAGNSAIVQLARDWFQQRGGSAVADACELMLLHPRYAATADEDDHLATAVCGPTAAGLAWLLLEEAMARRVHLVVDTCLWASAAVMTLADRLKAAGYRAQVIAVAVDPEVSWQAVQERYRAGTQARGVGPWIERQHHDDAHRSLPESLKALALQGSVDAIHVIDHTGGRLLSQSRVTGFDVAAVTNAVTAVGRKAVSQPTGPLAAAAAGKRRLKLGDFAVEPEAALSPSTPPSVAHVGVTDEGATPRKIKLGRFAPSPEAVPGNDTRPVRRPSTPTSENRTVQPNVSAPDAAEPGQPADEPESQMMGDGTCRDSAQAAPGAADSATAIDWNAFPAREQEAIRRRLEWQEKLRRRAAGK